MFSFLCVASLSVELTVNGREDLSNTWCDAYAKISKDKDVLEILPLFQTMNALKKGLYFSEQMSINTAKSDELKEKAKTYLEYAVDYSRLLSPA